MSLKDELMKAREFDEKHAKRKFSDYNAIFSDPKQWASSIDWYDGARTMYAKDQKLFDLLCDVAVAAENTHRTFAQFHLEKEREALAALKAYVAGEL